MEQSFVPIGGIDQWIAIRGDDRDNPVVLVLHGGPGDAWSPFAGAMFAGWEKDVPMVEWDQRGAGRTYGKSGPSVAPTMTVERMVQDGIAVSAYLAHRMHKKKIIIVRRGRHLGGPHSRAMTPVFVIPFDRKRR